MKTFDAIATREGQWWVVEIEGIGATQGRSAHEAQTMANDLAAAMLDVATKEVHVNIEFQPPGDTGQDIHEAREALQEAEKAQRWAAKVSRRAARRIVETGLSQRDAAAVLGVTPQRVSQLLSSG